MTAQPHSELKVTVDVHKYTNHDPETRDDAQDPYRFETVEGFFCYNDPLRATPTIDQTVHDENSNFGLLNNQEDRWVTFKRRVQELQEKAPEGVVYKVLFCGRHAQGWHNIGNEKYDQITWDTDYARRNGDDEITWGPDAYLTPLGEEQSRTLGRAWKANLAADCPRPEKWFLSPFTRTSDTMKLSFGEEVLQGASVTFVEALREIYGEQTCDKRRSKSYLAERYPAFGFEKGFAEEDPWWKPDERELEVDRRVRIRQALYKIFDESDETYISITSHACATISLFAVLRHPIFKLGTSGMVPIVVKATKGSRA